MNKEVKPPKIRFYRKGYEYVRLPLSSLAGARGTIVINPDIQFGEPTIGGTRIPAEVIYSLYLGGDSPERLAEMYCQPLENIQACIDYGEGRVNKLVIK